MLSRTALRTARSAKRVNARALAAAASAPKIVYTKTDEAPALATYSLLPIIQKFVASSGIKVDLADISLAGRVIAHFPENLTAAQKQSDELAELGELCKTPEANVIKLPNVSASIPQLVECIAELQAHGYDIPNYPESPANDAEREIAARYSKVLGSAVNPVLREGNSDRRCAAPVKKYAQNNPEARVPLGPWSTDSKCHVAHMTDGDFYSNEKSTVMGDAGSVKISLHGADGSTTVLKEELALQAGEVIDATFMNAKKLRAFFEAEMQDAKANDVLLSLHLKATMMKVSDPIMFGHAVTVFFKDVFEKHAASFEKIGVDANKGFGDLYAKIDKLPQAEQDAILADVEAVYAARPRLAMVDSGKGITNLHVPSDVIIDASMPNVVRDSGKMWGWDNELHDTKAIVPDRCYAGIYKEVVDFCRENGAFDASTMGHVPNVGLMAQKAQEYGSHDKTFEIPQDGTVKVTGPDGSTIFEHQVETGDIWRMCQTKDAPIRDWVKLAVTRSRASGAPAIFWLDPNRAHDTTLIKKVNEYLGDHDTSGLEIEIKPPIEAMRYSAERAAAGKDTISVTGNVLRDYLTDLFPIIELGTSAKMLSIVPLLAGGGLFETGAGGSAPKHVQQFNQEGHLRWDSLGEFLALAVSIEDLGTNTNNAQAMVVADALNQAVGKVLDNEKSPMRKVGTLDNRGSHFYLAMYWAQALAAQSSDSALASEFAPVAQALTENEAKILEEIAAASGSAVDVGGYYHPNDEMASKAMRPSATLNSIIG
jgi:isocitrate dehydrogenase